MQWVFIMRVLIRLQRGCFNAMTSVIVSYAINVILDEGLKSEQIALLPQISGLSYLDFIKACDFE